MPLRITPLHFCLFLTRLFAQECVAEPGLACHVQPCVQLRLRAERPCQYDGVHFSALGISAQPHRQPGRLQAPRGLGGVLGHAKCTDLHKAVAGSAGLLAGCRCVHRRQVLLSHNALGLLLHFCTLCRDDLARHIGDGRFSLRAAAHSRLLTRVDITVRKRRCALTSTHIAGARRGVHRFAWNGVGPDTRHLGVALGTARTAIWVQAIIFPNPTISGRWCDHLTLRRYGRNDTRSSTLTRSAAHNRDRRFGLRPATHSRLFA